jgi:hypothetical protein
MNKLILIICLFSVLGCSRAKRSAILAINSKHRITLYSGGQAVRTWVSSGKIENESKSDGYYFQDDKTGKLIRVSGQILIEQE